MAAQEYVRINNEHYSDTEGEDFISFHFNVSDCSLCVCVCSCVYVCMCLIMGMGQVVGFLVMGTGRCGFALDIMMCNRSVLVRSFTGTGGCLF